MKNSQPTTAAGPDALETERMELVRRVIASRAFQKSPKLCDFLEFVCACSIRHGSIEEVKEQQIGVHVFHRRPDYNPSDDSIVRVQARELRKRLAAYFETEGKDEALVITIPKGGYLPSFVPAESTARIGQESEIAQGVEGMPGHERSAIGSLTTKYPGFYQWIVATLGGFFLLGIGWTIGMNMRKPSPEIFQMIGTRQAHSFYETLLGPIGRDGGETLLVFSNPKLLNSLRAAELGDPNVHSMPFFPVPRDLGEQLTRIENPGVDSSQPTFLSYDCCSYTGMGEAATAFNIGEMMGAIGRSARLTQGRFLNWDTTRRQNLIVLGSPTINTWTRTNIVSNFAFVLNGIRNSAPLPGERATYMVSSDATGNLTEDYGLISMSTLPSGTRVLTLAGKSSAGTYGTGDFFTDPDKMRVVYEKLQAKRPGMPFPENWEILIHISIRDNIPVDTALVTFRVSNLPAAAQR